MRAEEEAFAGDAGPVAEDRARADCYALVGRLFYGPPDEALLAEVFRADGAAGEGELARAWSDLQQACDRAHPAQVRQEYDALFVGVGRALVTPYTSRYAHEGAPDKHLVRLRDRLDAWGLARQAQAFETEDHIAGVCDVMRYLIMEGAPLDEQRRFFDEFVYPGALPFLAALDAVDAAVFYKRVAGFARAFLEVEKDAFGMGE